MTLWLFMNKSFPQCWFTTNSRGNLKALLLSGVWWNSENIYKYSKRFWLFIFIPVLPPSPASILYIYNLYYQLFTVFLPSAKPPVPWSQLRDSGYNTRTKLNPTDPHIQEIKTWIKRHMGGVSISCCHVINTHKIHLKQQFILSPLFCQVDSCADLC